MPSTVGLVLPTQASATTSPSSIVTSHASANNEFKILSVVLTALNIVSAVVLGGIVCWDARNRSRTARKEQYKEAFVNLEKKGIGGVSAWREKTWWQCLVVGDLYPLVLSTGMFLQGLLLLTAEIKGLERTLTADECQQMSEIAWAAIWIPPCLTLSFSVETALRSFSTPRFKPRSIYGRFLYCGTAAALLVIFAWVPSRATVTNPATDVCTGELMRYVDQFSSAAIGIFAALIPLSLFIATIIFLGLSGGVGVDLTERVAASRQLYFLVGSGIQWLFILPFFAASSSGSYIPGLGILATVVINISAVSTLIVFLYLRRHNVFVHPRIRCGGAAARENHRSQPPEPRKSQRAARSFVPFQLTVTKPAQSANPGAGIENKPLPKSPSVVPSEYGSPRNARFSASTARTISFQRIGDEITVLMKQLVSATSKVPVERASRLTARPRSKLSAPSSSVAGSAPARTTFYTEPSPEIPSFHPSRPTSPVGTIPIRISIERHPPPVPQLPSGLSAPPVPSSKALKQPPFPTTVTNKKPFTLPRRPSRAHVPPLNLARHSRHGSVPATLSMKAMVEDRSARSDHKGHARRSTAPGSMTFDDERCSKPAECMGEVKIGIERSLSARANSRAIKMEVLPETVERAIPPGTRMAQRRSEDAESFKEIPAWR